MEWTSATMELGVIAAVFLATTLCCVGGFRMRARIERGIRSEYRELFGVCRRSMMQGNEYAPSAAELLETQETTVFRPRFPSRAKARSLADNARTRVHDMTRLARAAEKEFGRGIKAEVTDG